MVRKLATALLASLLVAQSFAALASPCLMASGQQEAAVTEAVIDHSKHHMMAATADTDAQTGDCCAGGYCSQDGCSHLSLLAQAGYKATVARFTPYFQPLAPTTPQRSPGTLFRPPSV